MPSLKIISGGQTGADRGALTAALEAGVACGGWCPAGRRAEDGVIPAHFPVSELPSGTYEDRTRHNVADADGTVLFFAAELVGGSLLTRQCAEAAGKPLLLIDADCCSPTAAAAAITDFMGAHNIQVLNVAGPRASDWPEAEQWVRQVMARVLAMRTPGAESEGRG